ncbi:MAG: HTTM domain-containing protein [Tepidisphaeraceae bacterium]
MSLINQSEKQASAPVVGKGELARVKRPRTHGLLAVDLRSLAAMRIGLGLVLLCDLGVRASDLTTWYTDDGVLPRGALLNQFADRWEWSVHLMGGNAWYQGALFGLAGLATVLFTLGLWTRVATIVTWALLISMQTRNPMINDGGDVLLRASMFWSIFLPLGARWSLDTHRAPPDGASIRDWPFVSVASVALLFQICMLYVFSALHKTDVVWWDGRAVDHALKIDFFITPLGELLRGFPSVTYLMTFATLAVEALVPLLLFVPDRRGAVRLFMVLTFWSLHVGLGLCLELGHFSYICGALWIAFLPPQFWDGLAGSWIGRGVRRAAQSAARGLSDVLGRLPRRAPVQIAPTVGSSVLVLLIFLYVLMWNVRTLDDDLFEPYFPHAANPLAIVLRLDQRWDMFAPRPLSEDGWFVIPAKLADGSEVELLNLSGAAVTWERPRRMALQVSNTRWRKYLTNLWFRDRAAHRPHYLEWLVARWNAANPRERRVKEVRLYYMLDRTIDAPDPGPAEKVMLWETILEE